MSSLLNLIFVDLKLNDKSHIYGDKLVDDTSKVKASITSWKLEKRDADGNIFEIITGGQDKPTVVEMSTPGQPPSSYYQGKQ